MRERKTMEKESGEDSPNQKGEMVLEALRCNMRLLGELAVRYEVNLQPEPTGDLPAMKSPQDVHDLLAPEMSALAQEQLRVLILNRRNRLLGQRVVYQGNAFSAMIRPAEVLRPAILENATSIIVVHNHPSNDTTPSPEDIQATRELAEAGKIMGIEVLDHVIIGGNGFISLKGAGLID